MTSATPSNIEADRRAERGWATDGLVRAARISWFDVLVAALLGTAMTAFAILYRSPIVPTDPWHYVRSALEFPSANWVPLGFTRYGIILANIPPGWLFKNAEASYYFWPLVSVWLMASMTYLLGRRFWGPVAGVVAVVVLFTNGVLLLNLTRGYPDVMSIAILSLAAVCAVLARDRDLRGPAGTAWIVAAGFCLGWGFEVRETFLFGWPLVLGLLWRRGRLVRTYAVLAVPVVFWALVDVGISGLIYGDPLLKLHTLMGTNPTGVGNVPPPSPFADDVQGKTRWEHFLSLPQTALTRPDGTWLVASGILGVLAVLVPNRALRLVSGSFIVVLVLNLLAGGVLLPDRPFGALINQRYWIQYLPYLALVVGGLTVLVCRWLLRRLHLSSALVRRTVVVVVAVLACAVPVAYAVRYIPTVPSFAANGGNDLEELRAHLEGKDFRAMRVWTDWETKRLLPAYQRPIWGGEKVWHGRPTSLTGPGTPAAGDAVLLYSPRSDVCVHCRHALEPWLEKNPTIPANWELVYDDPEGTLQLYRVH